jgi:hypothetical protein
MINSKNMTKIHSSYWMQDWDDDTIVFNTMNESERKSHDLYKMAASKRAISNFVSIVTNQSIPVNFSERGNSYTDGQTVVIGSNITEPKDFDIAVGLALHEGSHIKLSDFKLLQRLDSLIPTTLKDTAVIKGILNPISTIKDIWNYVEDRRIDWYVFNQAPGYRDYYRAMYDKYFNDPLIDKGLKSDEYTDETIESYMFRIINLHNQNTNLTKLGGLRKIYSIIGLGNISRLKNTQDTLDIAMLVFEEILNQLPPAPQSQPQQSQNGDGQSSDGENGENGGEGSEGNSEMGSDESEESNGGSDGNGQSDMTGDMGEPSMGGSSMSMESPADGGKPSQDSGKDNSKPSSASSLSDAQKKLLDKKIEKQKEFVRGKINKKGVSRKDAQDINSIEQSGTEIQSVGNDVNTGWGNPQRGTECIVVKKLTESLMNSEMFPLTFIDWKSKKFQTNYEKEIANGIRIGTILGKKLQVRGESRTTVFNRQKNGRIDKRLISSLGFGNENVFQYLETDSYSKANLHVSIDASGSMSGIKWQQTLTNVTALCKAVDMISNLSIQISIRTTDKDGGKPYVVIAYDSRVDKFSKVKKFFPGFNATGTTPEGLCYEAIMKQLVASTNDTDSYFLNISDGEPYFQGRNFQYNGEPAFNHTAKMVKQIEGMGIKTLSYFVEEHSTGNISRGFRKMYGKGASAIDVTNVSQITKTINNLFLSK